MDEYDFVALDVETANPDFSSICQVGLAFFKNGVVCRTAKTYVNPEDYFDPWNVQVHGITEEMVKGAPTFPQIADKMDPVLLNQIVVHHTAFDKISISQASEKYDRIPMQCRWLDSARVARRTWEDVRSSGYGLGDLSARLGIVYQAHDALEDARAAGEVLLRAIEESGTPLDEWLVKAYKKTTYTVAQTGNPDGPLAGEVVVFTGQMEIPRREAAAIAAEAGCDVSDGVNKNTTLLVVGNQDIRRLAGNDKSSKHRKAETMISKGAKIRIITETDFVALVAVA